MSQDRWTAVDAYFNDLLIPPDPALDNALRTSAAAGLPPINVAPNQGKLLHLLARLIGAKHILEVGTLGGYGSIWLARACRRAAASSPWNMWRSTPTSPAPTSRPRG